MYYNLAFILQYYDLIGSRIIYIQQCQRLYMAVTYIFYMPITDGS